MVVTGGKTGYVFAVKDRTGEVAWQFAASGPVLERIAVIGTDIYCPTSTGGLHALNLMTGKEQWYAPEIRQFIAASQKRLYTLDNKKRLVVLDRMSGNPVSSFDVHRFDQFFFNIETDQIYVINESGLIQCLQERQPQNAAEETFTANKQRPPLQHRLNCRQYIDVINGKPSPQFYWQDGNEDQKTDNENNEDIEDIEDIEKNESTQPASDEKIDEKVSGEDESLDGNE
jgi:hypothetical protein